METSLHQQLKQHYATSPDQMEVTMGRYRIDVVRGDELIEVQCASLSAIRRKVLDLTRRHRVCIVKPLIDRTRICKRTRRNGPFVSRRWSPKRGQLIDLFDELIYLTGVFPLPKLSLEVPIVDVEQHRLVNKTAAKRKRVRRRRDPGYLVQDVSLDQVHNHLRLTTADDLWQLLPSRPEPAEPFNTADLARRFDCPRWIAQKIAYVLRHAGAIEASGRDQQGIRYLVQADDSPLSPPIAA